MVLLCVAAKPINEAASEIFTSQNLSKVPETLKDFYLKVIFNLEAWDKATPAGVYLPIAVLAVSFLVVLLPVFVIIIQIGLACCTKTQSLKKEVKKKARENNYLKQSIEINEKRKREEVDIRPVAQGDNLQIP